MVKHGADVNAQVTGAASYSGRIARALTGDPVNTKSNEGMTALHVAVRSRNASLRPLPDRQGSANRHQGCVGKDAARRAQRRAGVSACCICRCGWRRASQSQCRSCRSCGSGARGRRSGGWAALAVVAAALVIPLRFRKFGPCCRGRRRTSASRRTGIGPRRTHGVPGRGSVSLKSESVAGSPVNKSSGNRR